MGRKEKMSRKEFLTMAAVAASAVLSAFAVDVPPPCAPVPVRKAVKVERREIAVSIIGKGLLSRAKCSSVEEMIAYWTAAMDEEIGNKPDLVVLPEICDVLQGVSPQEKADWLRRRGNRVLEAFAAYAKRHRCYLVYPTYRQLPDGAWANCAIVIDRDGDVVGVYDKYQPTVRDLGNPVLDVRPGTGTCVVETDFGRLGVMICFDLNFQPIQDLYAKENVDVLAFPSYYDGGHNRHTWAARCQAYVVAATVGSPRSPRPRCASTRTAAWCISTSTGRSSPPRRRSTVRASPTATKGARAWSPCSRRIPPSRWTRRSRSSRSRTGGTTRRAAPPRERRSCRTPRLRRGHKDREGTSWGVRRNRSGVAPDF